METIPYLQAMSGAKIGTPGRRLIYIPIVHTPADMGELRESVRLATLEKVGQRGWRRKVDEIERVWSRIERTIDNLRLPCHRVRIYQDGLPVCGHEARVVRDLARGGSRNYQLILRLMERGARVMGTESPQLLVREYELAKRTLASAAPLKSRPLKVPAPPEEELSASLLESRDRFIADRVNSTLESGEVGILFLGMLHSLKNLIDPDIRVEYPLYHPLGRRRF